MAEEDRRLLLNNSIKMAEQAANPIGVNQELSGNIAGKQTPGDTSVPDITDTSIDANQTMSASGEGTTRQDDSEIATETVYE